MNAVSVFSEIGRLKQVLVHTPGSEVEKMTPDRAQRALYSDILNLDIALEEYRQFKSVLQACCHVHEVKDLLTETLSVPGVSDQLIRLVGQQEEDESMSDYLFSLGPADLARGLIEGIKFENDNLTRYLSGERYGLKPLPNFFFTRDALMSVYHHALVGKMASQVRAREALIMEAIFTFHPRFGPAELMSVQVPELLKGQTRIEGGDVLVASENVLLVGVGVRTSSQGVDCLIDWFRQEKKPIQHIIVQELPDHPESFIHLDMVFTFLDHHLCMVYEPLILGHHQFRTIHITIENGRVSSIVNLPGLLTALKRTGIEVEPLQCGGNDRWNQEREQWHSGANFLALAPGVVMGYERNKHTIDVLSDHGFAVVKASDFIAGKQSCPDRNTVITLAGSELARGGGGARCMSLPLERE